MNSNLKTIDEIALEIGVSLEHLRNIRAVNNDCPEPVATVGEQELFDLGEMKKFFEGLPERQQKTKALLDSIFKSSPSTSRNPKWMTLSQISRELGVSQSALSNWKTRYGSEFPEPVAMVGKQRLFDIDELSKFVEQQGLSENSKEREDRLLAAIFGSTDNSAEQFNSFLFRVFDGARSEGLSFETVTRFVVALAYSGFSKRGLVQTNDRAERAFKDVSSEMAKRGETSEFCKSLEEIFVTHAPEVSPTEFATSMYGYFLRQRIQMGTSDHFTSNFTSEPTLTRLIARLAPGKRVLNIGSGIGSLARAYAVNGSHVVGQEKHLEAIGIHELLAAIEGLKVELFTEDALQTFHPEWQIDPFDAVVSNPPWKKPVDPENIDISDPRWRALSEIKSKDTMDYFIESALIYLRQTDGNHPHRAIICVPPSWLFAEQSVKMRNFLVRNDYLESVIQLGGGLDNKSSLPVALLILSKSRTSRQSVRMIDARELGDKIPSGSRRELSNDDISKIVNLLNNDALPDLSNLHLSTQGIDVPTHKLRTDQVALVPSRHILSLKPRLSLDEATASLATSRLVLLKKFEVLTSMLEQTEPSKLSEEFKSQSLQSLLRIALWDGDKSLLTLKVQTRKQGFFSTPEEIRPDDVIISLGGPSLGEVTQGRLLLDQKILWPRIAILRVTNQEVILPKFLLVWAAFGGLPEFLESQKMSATTPFLDRKVMDNISIPIPPLTVQQSVINWAAPLQEVLDFLAGSTGRVDRPKGRFAEPEGAPESFAYLAAQMVGAASTILQSCLGPVAVEA